MITSKLVWTGLAALSIIAFARIPANGADIYSRDAAPSFKDAPQPLPAWHGPYIGAHLGGAWSELKTQDLSNTYGTIEQEPSGVFGGAQLGYNFQRNRFVAGIEADLGGMDLDGGKTNAAGGFASLDGGFYATLTGRAGLAADRALIYAKGGAAWYGGQARFAHYGTLSSVTTTDTFAGWVLGGGVEYIIRPNWSLKAEYLHFDFGKESTTATDGFAAFQFDHDLTVDTVKIGVNYHFSWQ